MQLTKIINSFINEPLFFLLCNLTGVLILLLFFWQVFKFYKIKMFLEDKWNKIKDWFKKTIL